MTGKKGRRFETILNHVRKRSKNSPVINKQYTEGFSPGVQCHFPDKDETPSHKNVIKQKENYSDKSVINLSPERIEIEFNLCAKTRKDMSRVSAMSNRSLDLPFEAFSDQPNRTFPAKSSLNFSSSRKEIQFEPPGHTNKEPESSNFQNHPMEANRGSCSLETAGKKKNVNSFLGFKSIFSFL